MSVVFRDVRDDLPDNVEDDNLVPVTDGELADIIRELGDAFDAAIEREPAPELSPEWQEILATEDMAERARLYEKYYDKIFPAE